MADKTEIKIMAITTSLAMEAAEYIERLLPTELQLFDSAVVLDHDTMRDLRARIFEVVRDEIERVLQCNLLK
jgi:hypothetical protein